MKQRHRKERSRKSESRSRGTGGGGRRPVPTRLSWREGPKSPKSVSLIIDPGLRKLRLCYDLDIDRIGGLRRTLNNLNLLHNLNSRGPGDRDADAKIQRSWEKVADDMFEENRNYGHLRELLVKHRLRTPFRADGRRPVSHVYLISLKERPDIHDGNKSTACSVGGDAQPPRTLNDPNTKRGHSVEPVEHFDDIVDSNSDSDALIEDYLESNR
jgi:hypothetical protein